MAYLSHKGFLYDIFISYARVDDESVDNEGWITLFHKQLEILLRKLLGRTVTVWRDSFLRGNELFDEVTRKAIDASAIFITYTSPAYFESEYCEKELKYFYQINRNFNKGFN